MKKGLLKVFCFALIVALSMGLTAPALAASVTDFNDVPAGIWYYDYVRLACENGLISGTSATTFSPDSTMTRGQFVTLLGRFANANTASVVNTGKYFDVPDNEYYTPYVYWAVSKGIANGLTETTFGANDNITKEQMATLLVRYANNEGLTIPVDGSVIITFGDAANISDYAKGSVDLLKDAGVISGNESGNFQPQKSISRAEATTLFVKFALATDTLKDESKEIDCKVIYATLLNDNGYATSDIYVGETKQISVMYVPENTTIDKTCTYVSGDTSVLTVDSNGFVTAVAVGSSYVTVIASNGITAVCGVEIKGRNSQITGFELAWGSSWKIETFTGSDGIGYYSYDWTTADEAVTMTREIGASSGRMLLSPQVVYSDGFKQIILPESYGAYKFSFSSSDPALVSINSSGAIVVHRLISPNEGAKTVILTVYSGYFGTSQTVTVTLYGQ